MRITMNIMLLNGLKSKRLFYLVGVVGIGLLLYFTDIMTQFSYAVFPPKFELANYAPSRDPVSRELDESLLKNLPCYIKNMTPPNFNNKYNCWKKVKELNERQVSFIGPDMALCLFQPVPGQNYKRHNKKTVFLGIGVHIGSAMAQNFGISSCGNTEYISWERRHHEFGKLAEGLIGAYDEERLQMLQKKFWKEYKDNAELRRTDVIICGFDAWHCLIFAPFNKKMIINSGYRFEGHLPTNEEQSVKQQRIFYDVIRYNPDAILAGNIIYDVMYHQHFLGSHKLIPIPAAGDYVIQSLQKEKKSNKCPGVPKSSVGWHPKTPMVITISPRRLSVGGRAVAEAIISYFGAHPISGVTFEIMEKTIKKRYDYCELGKYTAMIVLGYSVMSYFSLETAALGIPMFAPSPKLYAETEKVTHLIEERKAQLVQENQSWMKENPRSLNKGYNPNNDFNVTATERWVGYSAYFYYKGVIPFDNYEDLRNKIMKANFKKMHQEHVKHTIRNAMHLFDNVKAVDRYFHGYKDDVISSATQRRPKSFDHGMKKFDFAKSRPKFDRSKEEAKKEDTWVLIDYDSYKDDFKDLPDCKAITDTTIAFYSELGPLKVEEKSGCQLLSIEEVNKILPLVFRSKNPKWRKAYFEFVASIYATQHGANSIVKILKYEIEQLSAIDSKFKSLFGSTAEGWKQQNFKSNQLWLVWTPTPTQTSSLYYKTLNKFTNSYKFSDWISTFPSKKVFGKNDLEMLEDYLDNWTTDERENFFHVVDQLNFELAVKGYFTKSNAILHRLWMLHLSTLKFNVIPKFK